MSPANIVEVNELNDNNLYWVDLSLQPPQNQVHHYVQAYQHAMNAPGEPTVLQLSNVVLRYQILCEELEAWKARCEAKFKKSTNVKPMAPTFSGSSINQKPPKKTLEGATGQQLTGSKSTHMPLNDTRTKA